jgi:hypothetical protein
MQEKRLYQPNNPGPCSQARFTDEQLKGQDDMSALGEEASEPGQLQKLSRF